MQPLVLLGGLLLISAVIGACGGSTKIENVIIISIDTLRPDRLGSYGYDGDTSPALDRFAAEGVRFAQAISQSPWTTPSHMSMMTSLWPSSHTVNQDYREFLKYYRGGQRGYRTLPTGATTLAEILKERGFHTLALTGGVTMTGELGFKRGFDVYLEDARKLKPDTWTRLVEWIADGELRPFFLFFHTFEVHAPYLHIDAARPLMSVEEADALQAFIDANPEMNERDLQNYLKEQGLYRVEITSRLYDSGIRYTDWFLGRLFDELRERGLWDKTLIIVTSDHGEEFADHRPGAIYNTHCYGTYDVALRVPLLLRAPGRFTDGRVVNDQVRLIDLTPTILDLLEIPAPEHMQGTSLVSRIEGDEDAPRLEAFSEATCIGPEWKSLRAGNHKYIAVFDLEDGERTGIPGEPRKEHLFNIRRDPGEKQDLARSELETLEKMRARFFRFFTREALPAAGEAPELQIDPELEKDLRALGYLD